MFCLDEDAFCRKSGNWVLLCSLRKGSGFVIDDACNIVRALIDSCDAQTTIDILSLRFPEVERRILARDVNKMAIELVRCGLAELREDKWTFSPMETFDSSCEELSLPSTDDKYAVGIFYDHAGLCPDTHIDLTDACTERCVHCYVPHGQHDFLPYAICEKVLREFREQQGLTVQLTGGECMMHPDFAKICRLCRELDLNFIVMSNLTLCEEKIVALLKETDPQFVNVSLYSMDENEHDAVTQVPGSWRKTRVAIDALQEAGVAVRLATPLLKANQKAYPALKAFADKRRVHLVPDCDIIPRCGGDCSNLNYACTPEEIEAVLAGDKAFWDRGYGKNPNIKPEDKVCDIGKLLSINSKGLYYPCSGMHEYVLGDARQVTLTDVWKGEKMNYLRGLKNKDFPQCVGCEHRAFCKVCPAFNFNATGSLFKTIPAKCAVSAAKHRVFGEA